MSPYRNRNKARNNTQSTWVPVTANAGETRGTITFDGSVVARYKDNVNTKIKGRFTLERWSGVPTQYRINYNGFKADNEEDAVGNIMLPRSNWNPVATKGVSTHMKARLMMLTVDPRASEKGLHEVQITIPVIGGGHRAAKTVYEAFMAASIEMSAGEALVGRR